MCNPNTDKTQTLDFAEWVCCVDEMEIYSKGFAEYQKVQRVRELHKESGEVHVIGGSMPICQGCRTFWPCDTIKALDGEL